jgi:hypothetical protein
MDGLGGGCSCTVDGWFMWLVYVVGFCGCFLDVDVYGFLWPLALRTPIFQDLRFLRYHKHAIF